MDYAKGKKYPVDGEQRNLVIDFNSTCQRKQPYYFHNHYGYSDPINPVKSFKNLIKSNSQSTHKASSTIPLKNVAY